MNITIYKLAILIPWIAMTGCNFPASTPTPTIQVYADSAFSGYAFLDANFNGQLDEADTPLAGATFYVGIDGVRAVGETTDEDGYAFILIPASVEYPVTLSMDAPKDSDLKLIGPAEIAFSPGDESPTFLFSSK